MTNIEWTQRPGTKGETWNPVVGCRHVAEGCRNCYAETMSKRLAAMGQTDYAAILDDKGKFNGKAITRPDMLDKPLRWKKPRMVFVNSMSDLFHKDVPFEFIAAVYGVMAACPQHTFQMLTKRPERMREFFEWLDREGEAAEVEHPDRAKHWYRFHVIQWEAARELGEDVASDLLVGVRAMAKMDWPLPNVWHGVSIATQADADKNIPVLLQVPSAIRFASAEPLIEAVDLSGITIVGRGYTEHLDALHCDVDPEDDGDWNGATLDWVIVGGESGPGARPFDIAWARSIIQQCKAAGVPCFVKQLGTNSEAAGARCGECGAESVEPDSQAFEFCDEANIRDTMLRLPLADRKGGDPDEWPEDIRVRQYPPALTGEVTRG